MRRTLWLYRRCLGAHIRAVLEYQSDFWLLVVAGLLGPLFGLAFLGVLFSRIPSIDGWTLPDVVAMYSLISIAEGAGALLIDGAWALPFIINQGELDYALARPYPVVLQLTSGTFGFHGLGSLVTGVPLLVWALSRAGVHWTVPTIALGLVLLVSAIGVKFAIVIASNAVCFWVPGPFTLFAGAVYQVGELARFPITVYGTVLRVVLIGIMPYAFVSFFPATAVLHRGHLAWVGLLTPLVAACCVGLALLMFQSGLRRYESSGH
jgi:ABC-2 type transport system permease protein